MPSSPPARQRQRDIVVIGASAGGVTALLELAKALPADFSAPIFVVQHVAADSPSILPQLLAAVSALPAKHAENGELAQPSKGRGDVPQGQKETMAFSQRVARRPDMPWREHFF